MNCTFFHDPFIVPENQEALRQEEEACVAHMKLSLAHCAAMLGRWSTCQKALKEAQEPLKLPTSPVLGRTSTPRGLPGLPVAYSKS